MKISWLMVQLVFTTYYLRAQKDVYDVELYSSVTLQCRPSSARPDIPKTYQWYDPNDQPLGSNKNMIIERFTAENQGTYTCRASQIVDGQMASSSSSIYVKLKTTSREGGFEVNVEPTYESFTNGIIFLLCKHTIGDANNYRFEWINPSGERQQTSTYFKNKALSTDSGQYTCRMTRNSDNMVVERSTFVTIKDVPIKIETSGSQTVGGTLSLNCEVDRNRTSAKLFTTFRYEWLDPSNRQVSTNQNLNIQLRDIADFGFYTCRITGELTNPLYTREQRIEIRSSGRIPSNRETTTYTASFVSNPTVIKFFQSLELNCMITPSLMGVTYRIMHNNQQISSNAGYLIPRVDKENMGVYECFVSGRDANSGQMVNVKSTFTIQPEYKTDSKIELSRPPGPQITVRVGDKRELHCEIPLTSDLSGKDVVWYFDGREITQDQKTEFNIEILPRMYVSIAVLKNIQTNNQGRYECRIKGDIKEAYIIVMRREKSIEVNPSVENRKVGDIRAVEFHCRVDGYSTKNRDLIWTFLSTATGQTTNLDRRWTRSDDTTADETSFILLQQFDVNDSGTYICTEPVTRDTARAVLKVTNDIKVVVTPPILKLRVGATATVNCYVLNGGRSASYPEFSLGEGRSAGNNFRMSTQRLEAGKIQLQYQAVTVNDNGTEFVCRHGGSMAKSMLLVDPVCTAGFRLCMNGECINSAKFCDGKLDCSDGSDENQKYCRSCDPLSKRCENFNGQAATSNYFQVHWSCDGEDDCGNGFDESRCFGNVLTCGGTSYRCRDGSKSIPKAFMCDKDRDCPNGDDEDRCVPPTLISEQSPSYQMSIKRGETLTLTCQATGYPLPKIIWRYNWGCLTEERRMIVSDSYRDCSSTISTLTISDFQPGDDGIYNCEALAGGKRAWSRDYQVLMDFKN